MNASKPSVVAERVICGPRLKEFQLSTLEGGAQVLDVAALLPVDLSKSHGVDVTLKRLKEMAAAYSPALEMASLNLDHAYGGPSLGWCEALELRGTLLWARYTDLDPSVVQGIKDRRYTRQSSEFVLEHPLTGGWYFTGLALLGNARPAVPGLPPVTLLRPLKEIAMDKKPNGKPDPNDPIEPDETDEPDEEETPPPKKKASKKPAKKAAAKAVKVTLRASADEDDEDDTDEEEDRRTLKASARGASKLLTSLRNKNAELEAESLIRELGARVTPAMRRLAQPLLACLLGTPERFTVRLKVKGEEEEVDVAQVVVDLLALVPAFTALGAGEMADQEAELESSIVATSGLDKARLSQLQKKYGFTNSFGFRS
jgi:hypothetical protein